MGFKQPLYEVEEAEERKRYSTFKKDLKKYGITPEEYWSMFNSQDRKCACCKSDHHKGRGWNVDHNHITKKVRGIVCAKCNLGIGQLGDSIEGVRLAYEYLVRTDT